MRKLFALLTVSVVLFSSCSLFKKDPQVAVNEGVKKLAQVERGQSHTTVKGVIQSPTGEAPQKMDVNFDISGFSDTTDEDAPIFDLTMKIAMGSDDKKASGEIQVRSLNKIMYLKLNSLSIPGEQDPLVKAQIDQLLNTWWQLPLNESPLKNLSSQQKELSEKFKTLEFFTNAQEDGADVVQDIDVLKYRVEVNRDAIKDFILAIARLEGNVVPAEEENAIADSLKGVDFSGTVSVGDDDVVHRIKGNLSMQPDIGALSSFDIDYTGWAFGDKMEVTVPEDAKEFNQFIFLPLIGALSAAQGEVAAPTTPTTTPAVDPAATKAATDAAIKAATDAAAKAGAKVTIPPVVPAAPKK